MSEWEIIAETLAKSGWPGPDEIDARHWLDCAPPFETAHFLDGFDHADGKFHFKADWSRIGPDHAALPALPDFVPIIDLATADKPFRLVTAPARQFLNSTFSETPGSITREGRPTLLIHPSDAKAIGVADGGAVTVGNQRGEIWLHARHFDGLLPGVLIIEDIWPNAAFANGQGVNTLTSADAGPPNGGGVFHDTAVWVRRREEGALA
jgi:anaerobic selenocysteine-containing dehydrogenase